MAVEGKTILQTMERTELTGKEGIPFQEGTQNGHVLVEKIKEYIGSDVYICPGVFQTTEEWSTTDVESIVGNWDEFIDDVDNKAVFVKILFGEFYCIIHAKIIFSGTDILMSVSSDGSVYTYYITKETVAMVDDSTYIFSRNVINDLNSNADLFPLSANQGRILNEKIAEISNPASAEKNGLMSKEDKAKVDGIQFNTNENSVWFNGKKYGAHIFKSTLIELTTSSTHADIVEALNGATFEDIKDYVDRGIPLFTLFNIGTGNTLCPTQIAYSKETAAKTLYIAINLSSHDILSLSINVTSSSAYKVIDASAIISLTNEDINNTLTSSNSTIPLSAAMGKKLQDEKLAKSDVVNNLTTADASKALSAAQGKALNDKIEELITKTETTTESTKELQANTYYVFGEVETLTLTLAAGEDNVMSEYMFEFTSGSTPTVITPIDGVEWRGDAIEANKVYQASIVRGIGILVGRDIA